MKINQIIAVLFVLTFGALVANAATLAAPDPSKLAADWWSYREPKEPLDSVVLGQRVADIDIVLEKHITLPCFPVAFYLH